MNDNNLRRIYHLKGLSNKKKLFETIAEALSNDDGPSFHKVLDGLNAREKMGPTCIGKGVAIPHCKLTLESPRATIIVLDEKIKYSEHGEPDVDIIIGLLVPADKCDEHLHLLASIATLCEDQKWLDDLRRLNTEEEIYDHLVATGTNLETLL